MSKTLGVSVNIESEIEEKLGTDNTSEYNAIQDKYNTLNKVATVWTPHCKRGKYCVEPLFQQSVSVELFNIGSLE